MSVGQDSLSILSVGLDWWDIEYRSDDHRSTLVAPALVLAEAANALWAMQRCGDITVSDLAGAMDALQAVPAFLPVSMPRPHAAAVRTVRLEIDLGHSVYDCFYLALVVRTPYPVATANVRFRDKGRSHSYLSGRAVHVAHAPSAETAAETDVRSEEQP